MNRARHIEYLLRSALRYGSSLVCTTTGVEHFGSVGPLNPWVSGFKAHLVTDDNVITASALPRISRAFFLTYQLHPPLVLPT